MKVSALPCAIYTRKSSEEGLEQDFNSLDAQREACEAFVLSQKALGWVASKEVYADGGYSGGNVERPALQRLMADIRAKRVRVIVVYKVDRLTRSLADFAKMVELFDAEGVSFVSVTQQFNTTSSMGRLTLNVLLSFAQFEREVTGERIRDKIAASKRKGMWMGGIPPWGYVPVPNERTLAINEPEAERVREVYRLYLELDCVRLLREELDRRGWITPERKSRRVGHEGGRPFSRGHLYRILSNPVYIGRIVHKDQVFDGNHPAIVDVELWKAVQERMASNKQGEHLRDRAEHPSLLAGVVFDEAGQRLTPSHAQKGARRYRYYVGPEIRVPAQELEDAVVGELEGFLGDGQRLIEFMEGLGAQEVQTALRSAKELAGRLKGSPIAVLTGCLQRVVIGQDHLEIAVRLDGIGAVGEVAVIKVPVTIKRGGMAVRLIVAGASAPKRRAPDSTLVALLAKAHDWAGRLTSGKASGVMEIAQAEGVGSSYVNRVVQLAFLAPDMVKAICRSDSAWEVHAGDLIAKLPLPLDWAEQSKLLGFSG